MDLTTRQEKIVRIVKEFEPITGEEIAKKLDLTRATLRPDLSILTMTGVLEAKPRVGYYFAGKTGLNLVTKELKNIKVGMYHSRPVIVERNISVYDAICKMFDDDVGTLFVVEDNLLVGVVSRKDLLRASIGSQNVMNVPVNIIMTRMPNINYCREDDSVYEIVKLLIDKQIDSVPVVRECENGLEVIGRFTKTNVSRAFVRVIQDNE